MKIVDYFDLGLLPDEAVLGPKTKEERQRRSLQRVLTTLFMYLLVWLGVVVQKLLALREAGATLTWQNLDAGFLLVALVMATVIFPVVFPKVFVKMPSKAKKAGAGGWFFVQCCVAFQQGFFWPALLTLITPR